TAFKTPHLDALAANGMKFTDFHSSGAVCSPTRAGLMTGRYQQRAGIPGVVFADPKRKEHKHGLQAIENTFAELLLAEGYNTAMFGKWHLGYETQYNPTKNGFEEFRGYVSGNVDYFSHVDQAGNFDWWINDKKQDEEGYSTHLITNHAVRFIEKSDDRPFCLYVAHEAPHYPYQGPNDKAVRKVGAPRNRKENQGVNIKQAYREMVQSVDTGVGEIVAAVEKKGLTDETLIMFFSDNGATKNGSNGRLRGHKGSVWEGGHRVPFIASWPSRIKAGTTQDQLAITLDIMPTMLDLAGISLPTNRRLDGKSLVTALGGGSLEARTLYWEHGKNLATRRGEWKLVKRGEKAAELYNLEQDPEESSDIAAKNVKRTIGMLQMLLRWKAATMQGATVQPN
ncbi:MAG: sulfatase-like hydrolase/transferase, partial [Planctomycetaceae bacterium]